MKFVIAGEIAQSCPASLDRADTAEKIGEHLVGGVRLEFVVFAPVGDVICPLERRSERRRCSSLSATCRVENTMSIKFLPRVPDRVFFKSSRYVSASSWVMRPKDSSKSETICLPLLTKQP